MNDSNSNHSTGLDALMAGRHRRANRLWRRMWREYLSNPDTAPRVVSFDESSRVHPFEVPEPACLDRLDPIDPAEPRGLVLRFRYGLAE